MLCSFGSSTRYCLPDSCFIYHVNPETASRVTLASLGIGFQPNLMVIGCLRIKHQCLILWFCCGIKYQYKKTKKNIFVYFYLLIFSRKTTNTNVFLFIDILFLNYTTNNRQPTTNNRQPTTIFIVD